MSDNMSVTAPSENTEIPAISPVEQTNAPTESSGSAVSPQSQQLSETPPSIPAVVIGKTAGGCGASSK